MKARRKVTSMHDGEHSSKVENGVRALSLTLYEVTLKAKQEDDPWKHKRTNWINVIIAAVTYALVISDVPRAGAKPHINMRRIGVGVYAYFGSFAYGVMTFARDREHTFLHATNGYDPVDHVRTWSYVHDTTSTTLRSIARDFNSSGSHVLQCMKYEIHCQQLGSLPLQETFDVLDRIVDTVASTSAQEELVPRMFPRQKDSNSYQHTRRAGVLKRRLVDILYEFMSYKLIERIEISSYRITHFPDARADFDPCSLRHDRPYLCDAGPLINYRLTADPSDAESASVQYVPDTIMDQVRTTYATYHNVSNNITMDVSFFEGYTRPMTYTGGVIVSATADFEIVKIVRVRDCSGSECTTIRLEDYRFEGGRVITDVEDWASLVAALRVVGQGYFVLRVVSLALGCHFAFPKAQRSFFRTCFLFFSEVPTHVVAYGAPIPIILYVIAMMIDGPITNTIIDNASLKINGAWLSSPSAIYKVVCILMRRQWLLAFLSMVFVQIQTMSSRWDRHRGILSVRGHIFSIVSAISMVLGCHLPNFRDSRILEVAQENPDIAVLNIGIYSRDVSNQKLSGVYSDVISMLFCAAVYIGVVFVMRVTVKLCHGQARVSTAAATAAAAQAISTSDDSQSHSQTSRTGTSAFLNSGSRVSVGPSCSSSGMVKPVQNNLSSQVDGSSVFLCRTNLLPSTCGTLWSLLGLTCGWGDDVLLSMLGEKERINLLAHKNTLMLMNIVQLSDPFTFLYLKSGYHTVELFTYRDLDSQLTFSVAENLDKVQEVAEERKANKFALILRRPIAAVPFHELVRCR